MHRPLLSLLVVLLWWSLPCAVHAQDSALYSLVDSYAWQPAPIGYHVTRAGTPVALPFLGGLNTPVAEWGDLNRDGYNDLLLLDGQEAMLLWTHASPELHPHPVDPAAFPLRDWFLLRDIDGDGLADLFTGNGSGRVRLYRHTGRSAAPFDSSRGEELYTEAGFPVLSESGSYPDLYDIDGDGDLDFFTGNSVGTVSFYRNTGTLLAPSWQFETDEFGGIVVLLDTIIVKSTAPKRNRPGILHGASSVRLFDIDNNGLGDLLFSDFYLNGIVYFRNTGTREAPSFALVTRHFPDEAPVQSIGMNRPVIVPGADGGAMFVSVLLPTAETDNFHHYSYTAEGGHNTFTLHTKNYLPTIDAGRNTRLWWGDFNNDGRTDMVLAGDRGTISAYDGDGARSFRLLAANSWAGLPALPGASPALADLTGDGQPDCLIGMFDGTLRGFENAGLPTSPVFGDRNALAPAVDVGAFAAPALGDLDGDGDNDLVVGAQAGTLAAFRNDGGVPPVWTPLWTLPAITTGTLSVPLLADWNMDGRTDILAGYADGTLAVFLQHSDGSYPTTPSRLFATGIPGLAPGAVVFSGAPDIIAGCARGGIVYLAARPAPTVDPVPLTGILVYPNPATDRLFIRSDSPVTAVTISTTDGRVQTLLPYEAGFTAEFDISALAPGAYRLRIHTTNGDKTEGFVKIGR